MNPASDSQNHLSTPNTPIIDAEILAENRNYEENILDLELIPLEPEPLDSDDSNPSVFLKLTPWGLGAIALFLFSNLLLTWAQISKDPLPEMGQDSLEILPIAEINPPNPSNSQSNLKTDSLSTLPESSPPQTLSVPPAPPVPSPPQKSVNSSPPQQTLPEKLLPPALRPQSIPITQRQRIPAPSSSPTRVVPISSPRQTQPSQPQSIPAPPPLYYPSVEPLVAPSPPELSKDDQLRNILRQQIVYEETNREPEQSFNQNVRQKMLDAKMREFQAAQEAQAAQQAQEGQAPSSPANNGVIPSPPQRSQTAATAIPAPPVAPQPSQAQPQPRNVNDLVNTLEGFNQN
ncbi:MAG: hypothetical protein AB4041_06660 [Microcystaceae cyanobacterium]